MINLRFHLVSLVAVFLALGLGVTMGASFVNRATVDTLRDRVEAVENSYKDRGALLDTLSKQLQDVDGSAELLVGAESPVLPGRLADRPVVLVLPAGLAPDALDPTVVSMAAAGAELPGSVRLAPALDLDDPALLARVKERLGLRATSRNEVRAAVLEQLGGALAVLSAPVVGTSSTVTRPGGPTPEGGGWGVVACTMAGSGQGQTIGHGHQAEASRRSQTRQQGETEPAERQQHGGAVGEQPHQQIRENQCGDQIRPAPPRIGRRQRLQGQASAGGPLGQTMQHGHIPPTQIEPLAAHGMAAVGAFPHQHRVAALEPASQQQLQREGALAVEQGIGLETAGQGTGHRIQEARGIEPLQLAAAPLRCAPHQLHLPSPQGQHGERPLGAKQLPGLIRGAAAQLHLGGEAVLAIGQLPHTDAESLAGGGMGPVGSHQQIGRFALGMGLERSRLGAQGQGDRWPGLGLLQQQGHQGLVLADPTHRRAGLSSAARPQIGHGEGDLSAQGQVAELEATERHQQKLHLAPEPQPLQ